MNERSSFHHNFHSIEQTIFFFFANWKKYTFLYWLIECVCVCVHRRFCSISVAYLTLEMISFHLTNFRWFSLFIYSIKSSAIMELSMADRRTHRVEDKQIIIINRGEENGVTFICTKSILWKWRKKKLFNEISL